MQEYSVIKNLITPILCLSVFCFSESGNSGGFDQEELDTELKKHLTVEEELAIEPAECVQEISLDFQTAEIEKDILLDPSVIKTESEFGTQTFSIDPNFGRIYGSYSVTMVPIPLADLPPNYQDDLSESEDG